MKNQSRNNNTRFTRLCGANRSAELTGNILGSCKTGWYARISKGRERPLPRLDRTLPSTERIKEIPHTWTCHKPSLESWLWPSSGHLHPLKSLVGGQLVQLSTLSSSVHLESLKSSSHACLTPCYLLRLRNLSPVLLSQHHILLFMVLITTGNHTFVSLPPTPS